MPCDAVENLERYVRSSSRYGLQASLLCRGYILNVSRDGHLLPAPFTSGRFR